MARYLITAHKIRRRAIAVCMGIVYYFAFLACYGLVIVPSYVYLGLKFQLIPGWCWIISLVFAVIPLLWMPLDLERPSDFASWILLLCLILPANIIIFMVTSRTPAEAMQLVIALFFSFALFELIRRSSYIKLRNVVGTKKIFSIILPVVMILLIFAVFRLGGFKIQLSLSDVYDRRLETREIVQGGSMIGYMVAILRSVCVPIAVGIGVQTKKWGYIILAGLAVIAIFSLDGTKSTAVLPIVLGLIVWMTLRKRKNVGFWLLGVMICIVMLSIFEATVIGTQVIASMFVRREMAVTGQLTTYYWEFFSNNPPVMMANSIFGRLFSIESPYNLPTARLIGQMYFDSVETNANANIWASGFADFGYVGMVMVSIFAAFILKIADSLSTKNRFVFASACCGAISLAWTNSALHTSIMTNGVAGLLLALWMFPATSSKPNSKYVSSNE